MVRWGGGVYAAAGDGGGGRVRGCSPGVGLRGVCAGVMAPVARVFVVSRLSGLCLTEELGRSGI